MSHHEEEKLQAEEAGHTSESTEDPDTAELAQEDLGKVSGGQDTGYSQRKTPGVY
ncbi:hypothetical protein ACFL2Q_14495 [Thermodesulfobacteriota bacterium]